MPIYRINEKKVLFIHIPKCAGTSIESMLLGHPECQAHAMYEMGKENLMLAVGHCSPQHYHADILKSILDLASIDFCFAILRDPIRRLLSEHSMQLAKYPGTPEDFSQWYLGIREQRGINSFCFDNHLRPAKDFLVPQAYLYDLDMGLEAIWEDICNQIQIKASSSPILHIRPCDGPLSSEDNIHNNTLRLIEEDYSDDIKIQFALQQQWKPGLQWERLKSCV